MTQERYPPGPRGPFSALSFFAGRNNPAEHLITLSGRYGPVVHLRMARRHVYFINEPELVREVLVLRNSSFVKGLGLQRTSEVLGRGLLTSEGELHRRQRQLAQPAFRHDRVDAYGDAMVAATQSVTEGWSDGQEIDIAEVTTRLTLDIVARTLFGYSVASDADEIRRSMTTLVELFRRLVGPMGPLLKRLPLPRRGELRKRWPPSIASSIDSSRTAAPLASAAMISSRC